MSETLVFSDVHGNFGVLDRLLSSFPEAFAVCLGDVLGVGDNEAVLSLLRDRGIPSVKGNHEVDLRHLYEVDASFQTWINSWPHRILDQDILYCHTWIDELQGLRFHDIDSIHSAQEMFASGASRITFVGHSHSPGWWELANHSRPRWKHAVAGESWSLECDKRYVIDVGSLGEPMRDEDANYVLWNSAKLVWGRC